MEATTLTLYNSLETVKKNLNGISQRVSDLEKMSGVYITQSSLQTSVEDINQSISDMNITIGSLENKLQKITLPEGTRFYLEESEVTDFRNHFRQLRSMMSELEKSIQAFIRLAARYNITSYSL